MADMDEPEGVMSTRDRLIYMANQIARNLAAEGGDAAPDMVADHIRRYWTPAMRAELVVLADERPDALSPIAAAAVARIAAA